jgi:hypothetical protein
MERLRLEGNMIYIVTDKAFHRRRRAPKAAMGGRRLRDGPDDLYVFCPKMPAFIRTVPRDHRYIEDLARAVGIFREERFLILLRTDMMASGCTPCAARTRPVVALPA